MLKVNLPFCELQEISTQCNYKELCTVTIPSVSLQGCAGDMSDFVYLLFKCGGEWSAKST